MCSFSYCNAIITDIFKIIVKQMNCPEADAGIASVRIVEIIVMKGNAELRVGIGLSVTIGMTDQTGFHVMVDLVPGYGNIS